MSTAVAPVREARSDAFPAPLAARARILLVDDEPDIRDVLSEALGWEGYDVATAANGREALEVLRSGPPVDVVLLDLTMPIMSGWEFRRVQRLDPALAGIPVIVTSASSPGTAAPVRFLPKPFGLDELLLALAEVLRPRPALAA